MIQFDHVDYSYHRKQPVLKDINISIQRGEKIGVLGESGAGKSTIGSLILGQLKPTKGKVIERATFILSTINTTKHQKYHS